MRKTNFYQYTTTCEGRKARETSLKTENYDLSPRKRQEAEWKDLYFWYVCGMIYRTVCLILGT